MSVTLDKISDTPELSDTPKISDAPKHTKSVAAETAAAARQPPAPLPGTPQWVLAAASPGQGAP